MTTPSIFLEGSGCECDVTLDSWLRDTLATLPGAMRSVAARELVLAAREFFERSYAWQAAIEGVNAKAGNKQYFLSPFDDYTDIIAVLGVDFNGTPLIPMPRRPSQAGGGSPTNSPRFYYAGLVPDMIEVYPDLTADVAGALTFYVALKPKPTVDHMPRVAEMKYYDAILDGFLARMYSHPKKPYTDKAEAQNRRRSFNSWIGRYMGQAKQGYVNAQNWSYPAGWGVRRFGSGSTVG